MFVYFYLLLHFLVLNQEMVEVELRVHVREEQLLEKYLIGGKQVGVNERLELVISSLEQVSDHELYFRRQLAFYDLLVIQKVLIFIDQKSLESPLLDVSLFHNFLFNQKLFGLLLFHFYIFLINRVIQVLKGVFFVLIFRLFQNGFVFDGELRESCCFYE